MKFDKKGRLIKEYFVSKPKPVCISCNRCGVALNKGICMSCGLGRIDGVSFN